MFSGALGGAGGDSKAFKEGRWCSGRKQEAFHMEPESWLPRVRQMDILKVRGGLKPGVTAYANVSEFVGKEKKKEGRLLAKHV
jgi:hypothetical protein